MLRLCHMHMLPLRDLRLLMQKAEPAVLPQSDVPQACMLDAANADITACHTRSEHACKTGTLGSIV